MPSSPSLSSDSIAWQPLALRSQHSLDSADAATLIDKTILGCRGDHVAEIQALGRTLSRWRTEILNHQTNDASNGSTEGLNLVIKKVKLASHGFRRFDH